MARAFNDASSQYLVNTSTPAATATPLTMACWFNSDDIATLQSLITITDVSADSLFYGLFLRGDIGSDPVQVVTRSSGTSKDAESTTGYSANTWHHAAGVITSPTLRDAYIDGGSKGTDTVSEADPTGLDRTAFGALVRLSSTGQFMSGNIAEAGIWSAALDDAEVATLALGYSPLLVRPQSLVAYWPIIGRTSPEIDRVGGFDMTLTAAPTTAVHPRVIYPSLGQQLFAPAAAGASPLSINVSKSGDYIQVVTP